MRRVLLVLGLVFACGCGVAVSTNSGTMKSLASDGFEHLIGQPVPTFTLEDEAGPLRSSEFRGKVLLLDFWGRRCPPCRASAPVLERFSRDFKEEGLVVLGVNAQGDTPTEIRQYAEQHAYTYRFAWRSDNLRRDLGVRMLPTFVVVDRQGIVRAAFTGIENLEMKLNEVIQPLLRS